MCYEFLPPYLLDINPIKPALSAMKYHLHRNREYMCMAMTEMSDDEIDIMLRVLQNITPQDAFGWYSYCGYM